MRKIIWALPLAIVLTVGIGVPSASAATRTITATNSYSSFDDTQDTTVILQAGDCSMFGSLHVGRPNAAGVAEVHFSFNTETSHTNHFDQWHNSWKIVGFGNQPIATVNNIDGVQMSTVGRWYPGHSDTTVSMTTSQWLNIAAVDWTGSC